jgi:hypothetical protein
LHDRGKPGRTVPREAVRAAVRRVRAWGLAAGDFERDLAAQASATVSRPRVEGETRRGRDSVRVTVTMEIMAEDVGQALATAWWAFMKAAAEDTASWDTGGVSAEVRPGPGRTPRGAP